MLRVGAAADTTRALRDRIEVLRVVLEDPLDANPPTDLPGARERRGRSDARGNAREALDASAGVS